MIIQDLAFRPFLGLTTWHHLQFLVTDFPCYSLVPPLFLWDSYGRNFLDQFLKKDNFYCKYNNGHSKGLNNSIFICKDEFIYKDVLVTK